MSLVKTMYRGWPADFAPIQESVHAQCPEIGTGLWVDDRGWVVEGQARMLGLVGALGCLSGIVVLANLVPAKRRWW